MGPANYQKLSIRVFAVKVVMLLKHFFVVICCFVQPCMQQAFNQQDNPFREELGIVSTDYNEYAKRRAPYPFNPTTNPNPPYFAANKRPDKLLSYPGTLPDNILHMRLLDQALAFLNAEEVPDRVIMRLYNFVRDRKYFPNITQTPDRNPHTGEMLVGRKRWISDQVEMMRRMTWLYPDDGSYYRADMIANWATELFSNVGPRMIHKIFLFGNPLAIVTNFTKSGTQAWVYNVGPIILSQEQKEYFVIDPALSYEGPMPVKQWIQTQSGGKDISTLKGFAITNRFVFSPSPNQACDAVRSIFDAQNAFLDPYKYFNAKMTVDGLIKREWFRIAVTLGKKPYELLGDNPPWGKSMKTEL